jgi:hypothetical protein
MNFFYIPEDDILHSHRRETLKSYAGLTGWNVYRRINVFPVRYEMGFHIPEDGILHSRHRKKLKILYNGSCSKHSTEIFIYHTALGR